ncbi:MAG: hypothetical protein JWM34_1135 [Ilumatobacteraceae bacterium]|nr:hypothetical protein [Ilumatobacteraceae bacterium]
MNIRTERLADRHSWWRIADAGWDDPLDPGFAARIGGRWNPPGSFRTLYLNEDTVTARTNLRLFFGPWPYGPEDLRDDTGPVLVEATLPRHQIVADAHTPAGVRALGLPPTYPADASGAPIEHSACQPVGVAVHDAELRGVRCRSARTALGAGRELAWFPAGVRSRATRGVTLRFPDWFWS